MCGRFANHVKDMGRWAEVLGDWPSDIKTSYNVAPGADIATYISGENSSIADCVAMRWGLVPAWSKSPQTRYATFNARSETLADKPAYRGAWQQGRRCLIPVAGYYEWHTERGHKQPWYITAPQGELLVLAGLWEQWSDGILRIFSCTVITRPAVEAISHIHARMPLIINPENADTWLSGQLVENEYLLVRSSSPELECYPVSTKVNNARNNGPELIEEVEA